MRARGLVGLVLVAAVLLIAPIPSGAATGSQPNAFIDGVFAGSGTISFSDPSCDGVFSVQDYVYGSGRSPTRSGTVHVVVCTDISVSPFAVRGTFSFVTRTGATLSGVIVGTATTSTFHNTYTVTSGTGIFQRVSGTVDVNATFVLSGDSLSNIEGTYVGSLEHGSPA